MSLLSPTSTNSTNSTNENLSVIVSNKASKKTLSPNSSSNKKPSGFSIDDLISSNSSAKSNETDLLSVSPSRRSSSSSESEKTSAIPLTLNSTSSSMAQNNSSASSTSSQNHSPLSSSSGTSSKNQKIQTPHQTNYNSGYPMFPNTAFGVGSINLNSPTLHASQNGAGIMWPAVSMNSLAQPSSSPSSSSSSSTSSSSSSSSLNMHPNQQNSPMSPLNLAHQQQMQPFQQLNDPQSLSALHFHLQREQTLNMLRNGARFFDPRFSLPRKLKLKV